MKVVFKYFLFCGLISLFSLFSNDPASAITCSNFEIIYVRGSGQIVHAEVGEAGYETERDALRAELNRSLNSENFEFTELDETTLGLEGGYSAVKVVDDELVTGVFAVLNKGQFGKYATSVEGGVKLLDTYLRRQAGTAPEMCYVLTGYSQGAHVVGQFLEENADDSTLLGKIKYIGLIGDPKLDLDGIGIFPGSNVPWYRGDAIPLIQGGMLGNRKPYLPSNDGQLKIQSGSWCSNIDVVCSSNFIAAKTNGHFDYPTVGIPQMALEIASVINNPTGTIDKNKRPPDTCGPEKQDIVVLLDTSPLMRRDSTIFTDTPMYYGSNSPATLPTAGEMLLRSGCGDTRVAVVGYGKVSDGEPRLLLDFTKDPQAYDALLKSLYAPAAGGTYERTQFREAALKAAELDWRSGAGKTLFAITDIAGSGPVGPYGSRPWDDVWVREPYLKDVASQRYLDALREHDIIVTGIPVTHSYAGFQRVDGDIAMSSDIQRYMRMMSMITGGYHWVKQVPNYFSYNFKYNLLDQTINYAVQAREKAVASIQSVRGTVGQSLTLTVQDTLGQFAAAMMRGDSVSFQWYADCINQSKTIYDIRQSITFTPTDAGTCHGTVIARVSNITGGGCYSCPEPFPPYMYRSFPFLIDIKPIGYIPKIPAQVTNVHKVITNDSVTYSWDAPSYDGDSDIVYVIREPEGTVLAATTSRQLIVTDTDRTDPELLIGAVGEDGSSPSTSSLVASSVDERTEERGVVVIDDPQKVEDIENNFTNVALATVDTQPLPGVILATQHEQSMTESMPQVLSAETEIRMDTIDQNLKNTEPMSIDAAISKSDQGRRGGFALFIIAATLMVAALVKIFIRQRKTLS